MEFLVQLLGDQNFKIVLTTLTVINRLLYLTMSLIQSEQYKLHQQEGIGGVLTCQCLGRYIPQLIKKLGDSKNIIRSEAIKALIGIFDIMRHSEKSQNNFIALITPYLNNSSNWHIREELLNVLIISFLKAKSLYEFEPYQICDSILRLLNDQKERIQLVAMEAIAAFQSISGENKSLIREVI